MTRRYYMREGQTRVAPFSLRLTADERAALEARAGTMPLGSYIKSLIFADNTPSYRKRKKSPVKDEKALADVLACLGSSRIANNLNQLAKAANLGNLYFDEETKRELIGACDDVRYMRALLLSALGHQTARATTAAAPAAPKPTTSLSFTIAASHKRYSL